jgi:menaquinone-dependent protoporphyrinogen oxidase
MDRVLVAYGSKYGATAELAEAIGAALKTSGLEADVRRARSVRSLEGYRAAVVGSAVYAGRWRSDALRLLSAQRDWLAAHDVWLFSSGPVGEDDPTADPAQTERWTKPTKVQQAAREIGARDHVVFGGKVDVNRGFIRKKMALKLPEATRDRRDWDEVAAWAEGIAATLASAARPPAVDA